MLLAIIQLVGLACTFQLMWDVGRLRQDLQDIRGDWMARRRREQMTQINKPTRRPPA